MKTGRQKKSDTNLGKFARFVRLNYLEEYITESLRRVKIMNIPIMQYYSHLDNKQLREMSRESSGEFLLSLELGTAYDEAAKSLHEWETDAIPGLRREQIHPTDLVLIYSLQKLVLSHFLPFYTDDKNEIIQIVQELEEYHAEIQNNAILVLFQIQTETEKELLKKHQQLEEAQSIAHIGNWEWDAKTETLNWSKEMFRIFEEEPEELPLSGENAKSYFYHLNMPALKDEFESFAKSGKHFSYETEIELKNGNKKTILIKGQATFKNGKIVSAHGTSQDLTDIKIAQLEKELTSKRGEFISVASHELKTPLTTIMASFQLIDRIIQKDPISEVLTKLFRTSNQNLKKLNKLTIDLLNYTKLEQGHLTLDKRKFTLSNLVDNCCNHIHLDGDHYITKAGDLSLEVLADEQKIDQVVVNLVNNAVKYAPESTEIILNFEKVGSMAKVSVTDSGPGIPPDKISHLFERYYRADVNDYNSGLGLGLYICKEIITMHGGKIGVKSVPGEGTTFWFTIPLSKKTMHVSGNNLHLSAFL